MSSGLSRQRSMSNHNSVPPQNSASKGKGAATDSPFQPCAATASLFLYAEGSTVVCLHHDSLAIERKFHKHTEDIQFICVDNVSERGAGRLVVTYDVGKTAIVWDLFTGEQISRFASYEPLTVAAWMRNGNLAFGNEKGEVILFEPATSEHVSARTIFDPITAIAPSADCKTYAIGYRNGSILLAALQPIFTILHTLTTLRAPSPIAALMWHASSSKQRSDMLATHTVDGDLRVWSVAKPPTASAPRVIRALKRQESYLPARNWIAWSKNGRILQFAEGETWAWDVRTKDVTYEAISTKDVVNGLAAYGPTGTLFTIGADYTVQQYDVETTQMVADVRHMPATIPQTPPQDHPYPPFTPEQESNVPSPKSQSRLDAYNAETTKLERTRISTPPFAHNRADSGDLNRMHELTSPAGKTERTATTISLAAQTLPKEVYSPVSTKSMRKGSRLRQEVIRSPEERPIPDLFPYTRARLSDVPYRQAKAVDELHMTPDGLRQQMLSVVFGWNDDIHTLINEELGRLPAQSPHAVYLTRWLDNDTEGVAESISNSPAAPSLDWMRLALSCVGSSAEAKQIGQVFVEKLLTEGDAHAAVAILLATGDYNDAIEVYVSRNHHMEAVLLTCLLMPTDWQRQSFLVRKWGEHVVQNQEHHLAVRCFSCTGVEPSDPWTSPRAQQAATMSPIAPLLQPSIYHKTMERRGLQDAPAPIIVPPSVAVPRIVPAANPRMTPQASALKLVTSFGGKDHFRFPGLMTDDGTPINAAMVTPIAESAAPRSALSPGGMGSYRLNNMHSLNTAMATSRKNTPGNVQRNRLASIGETPIDGEAPQFPSIPSNRAPPTPADSGSDKEKEKMNQLPMDNQKIREELPLLLTPAVYEPPKFPSRQTPQTAVSAKTMPFVQPRTAEETTLARSGSRSRKPEGLSIRMYPVSESQDSPGQLSSVAYGESIERPSTAESAKSEHTDDAEFTSPPNTGNSYNMKSPTVSGRSLDQYISSLEQAQYYKPRHRGNSVSSKQSRDDPSMRKQQKQFADDSHSRNEARHFPSAKRSPSSPIPMSPEELHLYAGSSESLNSNYLSTASYNTRAQSVAVYSQKEREPPSAAHGERRKHRSRSRQAEGKSGGNSRAASRRSSPDRGRRDRGRSNSRREASVTRSPSSPEPMLPSEEDRLSTSSLDPALRLVSQNRQRLLSESSGHRKDRSHSTQRKGSPERTSQRLRSRSRQPETIDTGLHRKSSLSSRTDRSRRRAESQETYTRETRHQAIDSISAYKPQSARPDIERPRTANLQHIEAGRRTKELAQAELEARRLSLARRPSAPAVPFPGQAGSHTKSASFDYPPPLTRSHTDITSQGRTGMSPHPNAPEQNPFARSRPTTPRAMKHPQHQHSSVPELPSAGDALGENHYQSTQYSDTSIQQSRNYKIEMSPSPAIPHDMPMHPAFHANIGLSRNTTRNTTARRDSSHERGMSRERPRTAGGKDQERELITTIGEEEYTTSSDYATRATISPPLVPELQHLMLPPPPPPPPAPPKDIPMNGLRIQTVDLNTYASSVPLPSSAYPGEYALPIPPEPTTAISPNHRRGRSGNENQIASKIRTFAGRMRSTSRGRSGSRSRTREVATRSPLNGSGGEGSSNGEMYSPYESIREVTLGLSSRAGPRELTTVVEGR